MLEALREIQVMSTCLQFSPQYSLDIALRQFATFGTYVNPEKNELLSVLKELIRPVQEPRQYFLWGAAQTGKSHLLQAICNQLASTDQKAVYLAVKELENLDSNALKDLQQLDVICIDDVDHILGTKEWDHALFQLINELRGANKSLVMTATLNPNDVYTTLPDLASRLVWGPVYRLNSLADEQKQDAIQAHAKVRGFEISSEVCGYLLKRYPRELKKLVELLDHLDQQSLAQQRKVTLPFVKSVLDNAI